MSINISKTRRDFLSFSTLGVGAIALGDLLARDGFAKEEAAQTESTGKTHHPAKVKRVLHIVMCGGFSQIDSFDYKPALEKLHGKKLASDERPAVRDHAGDAEHGRVDVVEL